MENRFEKRKIVVIFFWLIVCMNYIYSQECSDGYTYFPLLPETATIIPDNTGVDSDSCLYTDDLGVLNNIITENNLNYSNAIDIGNQTWKYGRLRGLVASYNPNGSGGVNAQLTVLPESFGNLDSLAFLYLEWNSLTNLPNSFSQLTNLISLTLNNNWLTSLPADFGNINQLYFLDLGYNQLNSIPGSICQMGNLQYLYLFNNQLDSMPSCMCDLNIDWNGNDGGGFPYFGIGGNYLCSCEGNIPSCIANSTHFELTLDQFYYSIPLIAPQECCETCIPIGDMNFDGTWNVLDIVALASCVLGNNCEDLPNSCTGDMNFDD